MIGNLTIDVFDNQNEKFFTSVNHTQSLSLWERLFNYSLLV